MNSYEEAFGYHLDENGRMRRANRRRRLDLSGSDITFIIGIVIGIAQIAVCVIFPAYRQFFIDAALWGWNLIF